MNKKLKPKNQKIQSQNEQKTQTQTQTNQNQNQTKTQTQNEQKTQTQETKTQTQTNNLKPKQDNSRNSGAFDRGTPSAPNCNKCGLVLSGETVEWLNNIYHSNCFCCTTCGKKFKSQCINIDGNPFCDGCGRKAFIQFMKDKREGRLTQTETKSKQTNFSMDNDDLNTRKTVSVSQNTKENTTSKTNTQINQNQQDNGTNQTRKKYSIRTK